MKRVTVRLNDSVYASLSAELPEWRKLRGPRFSLNNLCEEKLSAPLQPTQWVTAQAGTSANVVYAVTYQTPAALPKKGKSARGK